MIEFTKLDEYDKTFLTNSSNENEDYDIYEKTMFGNALFIGTIGKDGYEFGPTGNQYIEFYEMLDILHIMQSLRYNRTSDLWLYTGDKTELKNK